MRYKLLFFIVIWCFFIGVTDIQAQTGRIKTVVIDAGHGGKDCGAVGLKSQEKDITLKVALKTGEYIKQKYPDVTVLYTRSRDNSVDLFARAEYANDNNADVFISIHCNSTSNNPSARGAETFVMGTHRDAANFNVAKTENASIIYEENADEHYGGFDPNSTEAYIALNFIQSEHKQESLELAELVQNELVNKAKREDRGVQQAGFLVLYKTAMPSILVEIGFISNKDEEKFMMSDDGQSYLASAIYRAFCTYKTNYDKDAQTVMEASKKSDNQTVKPTEDIVYKVQFASRSKKLDDPSAIYKDLKFVEFYEHNGMYKYTTGRFTSKAKADAYRDEVVEKGYFDAFVVTFKDGKRVE